MKTMIGFVNVNKPSGITSSKIVSFIKKQFNIKKVGHMGTLDPLAQGVLPVAIGKATRMFDYFLEKHKTYIAEFTFGATTDTLDSEGNIVATSENIPTNNEILSVLPSLIGKMPQIPPQFSAKKVNGRCAYDLARNGQMVDLKPKEIEIHAIKLIGGSENVFQFEIECSSGTYIRSIARDMADLLNSKAYMSKLVRTKSGKFDINTSYTLEELRNKSLDNIITKVDAIFDFETINLSKEDTKSLLDGKNVKVYEKDGQYLVKCDKILIGIGDVKNNTIKLKTCLKEDV